MAQSSRCNLKDIGLAFSVHITWKYIDHRKIISRTFYGVSVHCKKERSQCFNK